MFRFEDKKIPLVCHVFRFDLTEETLSLGCEKGDVPSVSKKTGALVAFNATQFDSQYLFFKSLKGAFRIEGEDVSAPVEKYAAFVFENKAEGGGAIVCDIVEKQTEEALALWKNVVGGFFVVLKDGNVVDFPFLSYRARVGLGLDEERKTMYVLIVEEKNSTGLSYPQCGYLFKALGYSDAMEFDGGRSTALYVKGKNALASYPWRKALNAIVVFCDCLQ